MSRLTHLGDPGVVIPLAVLGFAETAIRWLRSSQQVGERERLLFLPWFGVGIAGQVTGWLKEFVGRPRPMELYPGLGWTVVDPGHSFPSGHATVAFALAGCLAVRWPRGRLLWIGLATGVALSRIALGLHWPSDLIAGAGIGWGIVVGLAGLERRLRSIRSGQGVKLNLKKEE
jgi:undecaprenyl-diphosphatase